MTARKELLDFFDSANPPAVRIEQLTADAYQQGVACGRSEVLNEQQEDCENGFVRDCLVFFAGFGTAFFFASF